MLPGVWHVKHPACVNVRVALVIVAQLGSELTSNLTLRYRARLAPTALHWPAMPTQEVPAALAKRHTPLSTSSATGFSGPRVSPSRTTPVWSSGICACASASGSCSLEHAAAIKTAAPRPRKEAKRMIHLVG